MTEPDPSCLDCDDEPKLTAEEWEAVAALTTEGGD
jgi:hypothetical protein